MAETVEGIVERREAGAVWITLDRPEVGNAVTPTQRDWLIETLAGAGADPSVRVVVLAGAGKHFCTGADLSGVSAPPEPGDVARLLRTGSQRLVAAVLDCEKPVVAELHGAAAGIGAHLVLAADFVVAADESRLIEVFARRGLVPDGGGAYLLARAVGAPTAKRLLMLAGELSAVADEAMAQDQNMRTADAQEGLAAFAARRAPSFTGR